MFSYFFFWAMLSPCCAINIISSLIDLRIEDLNRDVLGPHVLQVSPEFSSARSSRGNEVDIKDVPYAASVQVMVDGEWFFRCAGSLVARDTILTSAICAKTDNPLRVILGSNSTTPQPESKAQVINVARTLIHPGFTNRLRSKRGVNANNLALLKLVKDAVLSDSVGVIKLSGEYEDFSNQECTIAGFGFEGSTFISSQIRILRVPLTNKDQCQAELDQVYGPRQFFVTDLNACSEVNADETPCIGDIGNGLVCDGRLYGIVNTASVLCIFPNAPRSDPPTYMRLPCYRHFLDFWISF